MDYQLSIQNNTASPLTLGLLDASNPATPVSIIAKNGQDTVTVPFTATYAAGSIFTAVIGGTSYTVTLPVSGTASDVAVLLTNKGQGFWSTTGSGSNTLFIFSPSGAGRLSTLSYTAGGAGGWIAETSGTSTTSSIRQR